MLRIGRPHQPLAAPRVAVALRLEGAEELLGRPQGRAHREAVLGTSKGRDKQLVAAPGTSKGPASRQVVPLGTRVAVEPLVEPLVVRRGKVLVVAHLQVVVVPLGRALVPVVVPVVEPLLVHHGRAVASRLLLAVLHGVPAMLEAVPHGVPAVVEPVVEAPPVAQPHGVVSRVNRVSRLQ